VIYVKGSLVTECRGGHEHPCDVGPGFLRFGGKRQSTGLAGDL